MKKIFGILRIPIIEKGLKYDELYREHMELMAYAHGLANSVQYGEIMMGWAHKIQQIVERENNSHTING